MSRWSARTEIAMTHHHNGGNMDIRDYRARARFREPRTRVIRVEGSGRHCNTGCGTTGPTGIYHSGKPPVRNTRAPIRLRKSYLPAHRISLPGTHGPSAKSRSGARHARPPTRIRPPAPPILHVSPVSKTRPTPTRNDHWFGSRPKVELRRAVSLRPQAVPTYVVKFLQGRRADL